MKPEEFEKLPVIGLGNTVNNDPTGYTELQKAFLPYIDGYHGLLWILFFSTLFFLMTRFILIPLIASLFKKPEKSQ